MNDQKYDLYIDGELAAENMELQYAVVFMKALFETYYNEAADGMEVTVKRRWAMPEEVKDDGNRK